MGFKKYLDTELFCPLSGLKIKGQSIPVHKMGVMVCENGALFSKCSLHVVRCFISDWPTVKSIIDNARVVKIVEVKPKPKEKKNVAS